MIIKPERRGDGERSGSRIFRLWGRQISLSFWVLNEWRVCAHFMNENKILLLNWASVLIHSYELSPVHLWREVSIRMLSV